MTDCPATMTRPERTEVQCGEYVVSFFDKEGPVIIQGRYGLWTATGEEARTIISHIENPDALKGYIDMGIKETLENLRMQWRNCHDV